MGKSCQRSRDAAKDWLKARGLQNRNSIKGIRDTTATGSIIVSADYPIDYRQDGLEAQGMN